MSEILYDAAQFRSHASDHRLHQPARPQNATLAKAQQTAAMIALERKQRKDGVIQISATVWETPSLDDDDDLPGKMVMVSRHIISLQSSF